MTSSVSPERYAALLEAFEQAMLAAEQHFEDPRVGTALGFFKAIIEAPTAQELSVSPDPDKCPNCDGPGPAKKVFCSELCAQEAGLIRYARRALFDSRIGEIEVLRDALGTRLLMLRGGGYSARDRTVPADVRSEIFRRDDGRCVLCGAVGTEIDHISGSSNVPTNLRLTCKACNGNLMVAKVTTADDSDRIAQIRAQNSRLARRIAVDLPFRICDDEVRWDTGWRKYKNLPKPKPTA